MTRVPIWQGIAETLRAEIAAGGYGPGDRLPSEADLAQRFGVNRHTVRHALAALAEAGQVRARRGSGVFVASRATDYSLGERVRFHQNLMASGRTPSRRILRVETRAATRPEAEALDLGAGAAVHLVEGLSLADGEPMALFWSAFPAARVPGLTGRLQDLTSITAALAAEGIADYTRASTRVSAEPADAVLALHLRLPAGAPVLRTVAVNVELDGRPIEYGVTWFAGDRVTLTVSA